MTRALFVSDIHIQSPADPKHELFLRFLDAVSARRPQHLFLVGDIFDLWIADRPFFVRRYAQVIERIRALREGGTEVHFFEGNHDLDLRLYWQHQLGVDVQDGPAFYTLGGQLIRVEHGDQMDPEDQGYLFLRWLLRTPLVRWLGRNLPDFAVRWIGERASRASRGYTSTVKTTSDERALEKTAAHARKVHGEKAFDIFVSGHVHVAQDSWQVGSGGRFRCFNLGTWLREPLVLVIDGDKAALIGMDEFLSSAG